MSVALAVKPWWELADQFGGEPRVIMHFRSRSTVIPHEQYEAYEFSIAGGEVLRESGLRAPNGSEWRQSIRLIRYVEPVTLSIRFALDFWTDLRGGKWFVADHDVRAVIEGAYEDAVRREAARPSLAALPERLGRGPVGYFDETDVA